MSTSAARSPQYTFLYGGDGYAFYLWVLYCSIWSIPWQQPPPGQAPAPAPAPAPHPVPAPAPYGMQPPGYPPHGAAQFGYGGPPAQAPPPVLPAAAAQPHHYQQGPLPVAAPFDHALSLPEELRHGFAQILGALPPPTRP